MENNEIKLILEELVKATEIYLSRSTFPAWGEEGCYYCLSEEDQPHTQTCAYASAKTWLELALERAKEYL